MKNISYITLISLSIFSSSGLAENNNITKQFNVFDRNQNGLLSRGEVAKDPALWSHFTRYDKDQDGYLSLSEFSLYGERN